MQITCTSWTRRARRHAQAYWRCRRTTRSATRSRSPAAPNSYLFCLSTVSATHWLFVLNSEQFKLVKVVSAIELKKARQEFLKIMKQQPSKPTSIADTFVDFLNLVLERDV